MPGSRKFDTVFADDGEHRQKICDAKKFADAFPEVDELEIAACRLGVYIEPDDDADSHAVHMSEIRKIENDLAAFRNEWPNLRI